MEGLNIVYIFRSSSKVVCNCFSLKTLLLNKVPIATGETETLVQARTKRDEKRLRVEFGVSSFELWIIRQKEYQKVKQHQISYANTISALINGQRWALAFHVQTRSVKCYGCGKMGRTKPQCRKFNRGMLKVLKEGWRSTWWELEISAVRISSSFMQIWVNEGHWTLMGQKNSHLELSLIVVENRKQREDRAKMGHSSGPN